MKNINYISHFTYSFALSAAISLAAGTDITINDGHTSFNQYAADPRGLNEAGSVSANSVANNGWDLKAFIADPGYLRIISGFDPINGNGGFKLGDIFFDTNNNLLRPSRPNNSDGYFTYSNPGYEYAIHWEGATGTTLNYSVYKLSNLSLVNTVYYASNGESDPYNLNISNADVFLGSGYSVVIGGLSDAIVGFNLGNTGPNYSFAVDNTFLNGLPYNVYLTQECGNDDLVGASDVPEADDWMAGIGLGFALAGYWGMKRAKCGI